MVASALASESNASALPASKATLKPKAKQNRASKKPKPTVIHADPSSFRKLVQQLTRSGVEESDKPPPVVTPQPAKPPLVSPSQASDAVTPGKSRIQSLAPPPLCPKLINSPRFQSKPLESDLLMRPTNSLSFSKLASFSWVKNIAYSPMSLLSPLLSPFTSRMSPLTDFKWPDLGTTAQPEEAESPGAIAFREALTVMLPTGDLPDEEASGFETLEGELKGSSEAGMEETPMLAEAPQEAALVRV